MVVCKLSQSRIVKMQESLIHLSPSKEAFRPLGVKGVIKCMREDSKWQLAPAASLENGCLGTY